MYYKSVNLSAGDHVFEAFADDTTSDSVTATISAGIIEYVSLYVGTAGPANGFADIWVFNDATFAQSVDIYIDGGWYGSVSMVEPGAAGIFYASVELPEGDHLFEAFALDYGTNASVSMYISAGGTITVDIHVGGSPATATATGPVGTTDSYTVTITYIWTVSPTSVKLYYTEDYGATWVVAGENTNVVSKIGVGIQY